MKAAAVVVVFGVLAVAYGRRSRVAPGNRVGHPGRGPASAVRPAPTSPSAIPGQPGFGGAKVVAPGAARASIPAPPGAQAQAEADAAADDSTWPWQCRNFGHLPNPAGEVCTDCGASLIPTSSSAA